MTAHPSDLEFCPRPGKGSSGRSIQLRSNFLSIQQLPQGQVHHYECVIQPLVPPAKNRRIYKIWEDECFRSSVLGSSRPVYDGRRNLYSPRGIPLLDITGPSTCGGDAEFQPQLFVVEYYEDGKDGVRDDLVDDKIVPKQYQITFRKLREISMEALTAFLQGSTSQTPVDAINVVDVLLRHRPSLLYTTVGRSFYTPDMAITIAQGAQLWQGFHQSVKPADGNLLINLDVSATAFYEPGNMLSTHLIKVKFLKKYNLGPLLMLIAKCLGQSSPEALRAPLGERDRVRLERIIKGLKVQVTHRGKFRRKFTILGLTSTPANKTLFLTNRDGVEESVSHYFLSKYGISLSFGHLPCIVSGNETRPVYLPLEVCKIATGQRYMRKLNERQVS